MEDTVLPPDNMLETVLDDSVDLDLMDELLPEEIWMCADLLRQEGYANNGDVQRLSSSRDSPKVEETENKIGPQLNPCGRDFAQYPGQPGEPGNKDGPSSWRIEARAHPGPLSSLKDRLTRTLSYIKESYRDCDVLVQMWVPMNNGDRRVLTTYGQPFSLNANCQRLMHYRNVSMGYQFSSEGNSKEALGLPGRVFLGKVPEWSPDVRYFTNYEYARVNYAQRYDVRGTLAIPIFQHGSRICLGVMEVLMTTERINYSSDLEQICNALQAVDLNSSEVLSVPHVKMKNDSYLAALPEISVVVRAVCRAHGLPLAQAWIPCIQQDCLKSEEQKVMLNSLSVTVQQVCQTLRVVTAKELEDEAVLQVSSQLPSDGLYGKHVSGDNGSQGRSKIIVAPRMDVSESEPSYITSIMEAREKSAVVSACASLEFDKQELQGFSVTKWCSSVPEGMLLSECKSASYQESTKHINESGDSLRGRPCFPKGSKVTERKRTKAEKTISLQLLRQYFAGSLKDAAKNLGVCPTTLKRICRQHGIARWPSRKIKKVGHSLRKLQVVIDSVQGVDGTFQLSTLYANFPKSGGSDASNQKATGNSMLCTVNHDGDPESSNVQHGLLSSHTSASNSLSSSGSRASGSSHSSGAQECAHAARFAIKEEASFEENQSGMRKRASSVLNMHVSSKETPGTLARSQSLKSLGENIGPAGLSSPCQNRRIGGQLRAKAIYGEEKIRFSLQPTWGIQELKQEIARRFHISNINSVDLKYLDDDSDWVLLTCDADLQECTDIYRSSSAHAIKIVVNHSAQPSAVSVGSGTITS